MNNAQPIFVSPTRFYWNGRVYRDIRGGTGEVPGADGGGQGDTGQGDTGGAGGLYDLSSAPEELRPFIQDELKKIEANTTRKFQEHADYRKGWEPFEQLGLNQRDPEEIQNLLAFADMAANPEQFKEWWTAVGEEMGLFPEQENGTGDLDDDDDGDLADRVAQIVLEQMDERLQPFEQTITQQQQEARVAAEEAKIDQELAALEEQHGEFDRQVVCQLALAYEGEPNQIEMAFADYQRINGVAENQIVNGRLNKPKGAVGGGQAPQEPNEVKTFSEASAAARERFKQVGATG